MVVRFTDIIYLMSQMFSYFGAMVYFTNNKVVDTFKRPLFLALFIPASAIAGVIQRVDHNWIGLAFYFETPDGHYCRHILHVRYENYNDYEEFDDKYGYKILSHSPAILGYSETKLDQLSVAEYKPKKLTFKNN